MTTRRRRSEEQPEEENQEDQTEETEETEEAAEEETAEEETVPEPVAAAPGDANPQPYQGVAETEMVCQICHAAIGVGEPYIQGAARGPTHPGVCSNSAD